MTMTIRLGQRWTALLAVCVLADARVDVFLASDRAVAPVATLNSVCDGATARSDARNTSTRASARTPVSYTHLTLPTKRIV